MHKIREILRLLDEGLSQRQIAMSLAIPRATVDDYVARAKLASFIWPLPEDGDSGELEQGDSPEYAPTSGSSSGDATSIPDRSP